MQFVTLEEAYGEGGLRGPKKNRDRGREKEREKDREREREKDKETAKPVESQAPDRAGEDARVTRQGWQPMDTPTWYAQQGFGYVGPWGTDFAPTGNYNAPGVYEGRATGHARFLPHSNIMMQLQPNDTNTNTMQVEARKRGKGKVQENFMGPDDTLMEDLKKTVAFGLFGILIIVSLDSICKRRAA